MFNGWDRGAWSRRTNAEQSSAVKPRKLVAIIPGSGTGVVQELTKLQIFQNFNLYFILSGYEVVFP